MTPEPPSSIDANEEIPALIETLLATERRLVELTGGEVDAIADSEGRTFLLRRAQEQLRSAEATKQAAILNALPAHIALLDPQGYIVSVNEAWRQFANVNVFQSPGYGVGLNYLEICDRAQGRRSAEAQRVAEGIRAVMTGRERSFLVEYPCHSPVEQRWFLLTVTPLSGNIPHGAVVMHMNITERKRADTERERFFTLSIDLLCLVGFDGLFQRVNPAFKRMLGFTEAEMEGKAVLEFIHPDDHASTTAEVAKLARGAMTLSFENRYRCKDGTYRWISWTAVPFTENSTLYAVGHDITENKRADDALRASELEFRGLTESMPQLAWKCGPDGRNVYHNQRWVDYTGLTLKESYGDGWLKSFHPDDRERTAHAWKNAVDNGAVYDAERRLRDRHGAYRWFLIRGVPQRDEAGVILWWFGTYTDIEEQKRAEARLQRQQTELRVLFDLMPAMIWFKDTENVILRINQRAADAVGKSVEEIEGKSSVEIYPKEAASYYADDLEVIKSGAPKLEIIETLQDPTGKTLWVQTDKVPVRDKEGKVVGIVVMAQDISVRKEAEESIRKKDALIRIAGRVTRTGGWVLEIPSQHLFWSDEVFAILEYPLGTAPPVEVVLSLYTDEWREKTKAALQACVDHGTPFDVEVEILTAKKNRLWVRVCGEAERGADGSVERVQGAFQNISVRKQAELRLELQHAVTATLAEAASTAEINVQILEILCRGLESDLGNLWLVDRAAKVLLCAEIWHPASTEFTEFAAASQSMRLEIGQGLPGKVWASGQAEWSLEPSRDASLERRSQIAQLGLHGWIGFPIRIRDEVLGVMEFFTTKTLCPPDAQTLTMLSAIGAQIGIFIERWQLAEQFRQAQKMEAIGTLAGGVAHDFNNILAAITGYTELSCLVLKGNPEVRENLGATLQAARRATHLVRQILTFSRQEKLERRPIQLLPVLAESLMLLRSTIPSTIEFETSLSTEAPTVLADSTQIHQILMNLGTNAWQAMKDHQGRLKVSLEKYIVDTTHAAAHPGLRPGIYAHVSVSDTGSGMDQATQRRIFEPFFTTKAPGEGTGLGLAVVHGVMESHEGMITVDSAPGQGTTFHLYFPSHSSGAAVATTESLPVPRGHGERILVVDDEQLLVLFSRGALTALGYQVEGTNKPEEALAMVRADPQRYALVITDQTMPRMTGLVLASELRQIRPGLPIVLVTGYSQPLTSERIHAAGFSQVLLKPFTIHSLGVAAHAALFPDHPPTAPYGANPPH